MFGVNISQKNIKDAQKISSLKSKLSTQYKSIRSELDKYKTLSKINRRLIDAYTANVNALITMSHTISAYKEDRKSVV